ncbi:hypothetical protein H2248_009213 [Termitomyces sp. 'cryptogamus']|nr:hypothetical protein H2248_009213 [Termitomyces sp. 'cryptogamus']
MASLLSADMSKLLPTVKCSNCNRPVPLNDLSDHVCAATPTLPRPALSPAAAVSLLPHHLQHRLVSSRTSTDERRLGGEDQHHPPSSDRLRIDTASPTVYHQSRQSPLAARNDADRTPSPYQRSLLSPSPAPSVSTLPLRTRAGTIAGTMGRRPSDSSAISYNTPPASSPATARPSFLSSRDAGPSYNPGPPSPSRDRNLLASPVPQYTEPDTQSGGEAGMAGVGRRGFAAAAARVAMFTMPGDQLLGPRRNNATPYLDTDLPRRINETPPLSAGSGNSSHSPGVSPYPQSPVGHYGPTYPDRYDPKAPPFHQVTPSVDRGLTPPPSPLRKMPFDRNGNHPGLVIPNTMISDDIGMETPSPSTARAPREPESSIYLYSQSVPSRSLSNSTSASRPATRRPPSSTDSASDYEGLAYADHTDHQDEEPPVDTRTKGKANPPPPLPLNGILRSSSNSSMNHVHFSSSIQPAHERKGSVSSLSSSGGDDTRKSNSAAVAHALGLSKATSNSYARLGGPGTQMGGRGRSGTESTIESRSAHVRGGLGMSGSSMGAMEKEMKILMEEKERVGVVEMEERDRGAGLSKSKSTGGQRTFTSVEGEASKGWAPLSAKNPSVSSLTRGERREKEKEKEKEKRQALEHKLLTRTKSSTESMSGSARVKKPKVCLKCQKKIEDGRWVATESGGVLCERCWKHMYLPKCRRCNVPIENAAVSSADGQLKGKYHRECFNCHVCHKPFPDKSFYVFDGKPLCKYHYHEANESLCAATLCGQPIEGPCAVSHAGDRYHPEHMLCEYPGDPPCRAKLAEYWEVDGRMLCERHAHASEVGSDDERGEEEWVQNSKRTKRVTRYIDLAGGLPSGGLR